MKNIIKFALAGVLTLFIASCAEEMPATDAVKLTSSDGNVTIQDDRHAVASIAETGGTVSLQIESAAEYTLLHDSENPWYEYSLEGNTLTLSAGEIVSNYVRSAQIRVWDGNASWAYIKVSQTGSEAASISLDKDDLEFPEWGDTFTVNVESNKEWTVTGHENASWMEVSFDENTITVKTFTNNDPERKEAVLVLTNGTEVNHTSIELPVYQAPWTEAYLSIPQNVAVVPETGGEIRLPVTSNRPVEASSSASWMEASVVDAVLVLVAKGTEAGSEPAVVTLTTPDDVPATTTISVTPCGDPMILGYTIPAGDPIEVSVPLSAPANAYVDWGDGASDTMFAEGSGAFTRPTHTYEKPGEYEVRIYGTCGALMTGFGSEGWGGCITSIESWGSLGFTGMNYGLYGTGIKRLPENTGEILKNVTTLNSAFQKSSLEELPSGMFNGVKASSLQAVFRECVSLKSIPADLFEGAENITSLTAMFMGSGLESIPAGLFDPLVNLNRLLNVFSESYDIAEIPVGIFDKNTELTSVSGVFRNTAITSVPEDLFKHNTKLNEVFEIFFGCIYLQSIPAGMFENNAELTSATGIFDGCSSLTAVPEGMFDHCPELSSVERLFNLCTGLTSVPVSIFDNNKKLNNVVSLFNGCAAIVSESPYTMVGEEKVHLWERENHTDVFLRVSRFTSCFTGAVKFADYGSIPEWWTR